MTNFFLLLEHRLKLKPKKVMSQGKWRIFKTNIK